MILDSYTDMYGSGVPYIDMGDSISNSVQISGSILDRTGLTVTGIMSDTSTTLTTISSPLLNKSIYALNYSTSAVVNTSSLIVSPGDVVTYRITYRMPTSDVENLILKDYLPSPVFFANDFSGNYTSGIFITGGDVPLLGYYGYGPANTIDSSMVTIVVSSGGLIPSIDKNTVENSVSFIYGTFNDTINRSGTIDILFSIPVSSYPFADGLLLTNQIREIRANTQGAEVIGTTVAQFTLGQPNLRIKKGIVAQQ